MIKWQSEASIARQVSFIFCWVFHIWLTAANAICYRAICYRAICLSSPSAQRNGLSRSPGHSIGWRFKISKSRNTIRQLLKAQCLLIESSHTLKVVNWLAGSSRAKFEGSLRVKDAQVTETVKHSRSPEKSTPTGRFARSDWTSSNRKIPVLLQTKWSTREKWSINLQKCDLTARINIVRIATLSLVISLKCPPPRANRQRLEVINFEHRRPFCNRKVITEAIASVIREVDSDRVICIASILRLLSSTGRPIWPAREFLTHSHAAIRGSFRKYFRFHREPLN